MSVVHIYQFCRAFDNVRYSEVYGCYVSGGYAFEKIARASHEVPPEIREAVINDYFKLNDNYPPETGDFALIAREIDDKYSVLAVANRQLDDGGRPTIGYKYFWLEKSSSDVDGIGTLIYWWSNHKKPKFDMAELVEKSPPERLYYQEIQKRNFPEILKYVQKLNEIPEITVVKKELWQQAHPAYIELHYLALGLSDRATRLNAWAWNVHKIAYPERFLAIFYATQEDIPKNISKRQLPSPQKDNSNTSVSTPTKENTTQTVPVQKIKKCLKDIARIFADTDELDSKKTEELFEYLAKYPNENWSDFIDKTTLQAIHDKFTLIYKAEIYLLLPKEKSSFLIEILNSTNFGNSSEFHTQLLNASYKYQNEQIINRLVFSIYTGISYLLNQLMADENGSNQIEFLLTQSQSIWSKTFLTYAELVRKIIFSQEEITVEESIKDFCQEILTMLQKPGNIKLYKRNPYKNLVSTFFKINDYSLAGTFYYISNGDIPQNIPDRIRDEILLKISNIKPQKTDSPPRNNDEHQANKSEDDESGSNELQNNKFQKNETINKKHKIKPIPYNPTQYNPTQYKDNTQAFILFVLFLAGSILLKVWKSIISPPQILLLFVSIIYAILSVIVIHLTIDNFFNRRNHNFKQTNRIIGISLAIFYILVFVSIVWKIDKIPLFGNNNQTQLARQDTRKGENQNNIPGENRNIPHASPSNNINCPKDALTTFQAFKDCNKNESNKAKLEEELKTQYVLSLPDDTIAGNLLKYYLDSKNNDQFQNRKRDIEKCQKDHPITDTGNNDKRGDCIKGTIDKSKQPKKR